MNSVLLAKRTGRNACATKDQSNLLAAEDQLKNG
jgi:hypothetical protein